MIRTPTCLLLLFLLTGYPGPQVSQAADLSFEDILRRVDRYYAGLRTLKASFIQIVEVPALEKSEKFSGKLYFLKPEFLRLEYDKPAGQLLVADGRWYWFIMPQPDMVQAMRTPIKEGESSAPRYILGGGMNERYSGKLAGTEKRRGIATYVLDLAPKTPSPYYRSLRAWIDTRSFATRAVKYLDESNNFNTFDFTNLEENKPIPPGKFVFNPPPGMQILDSGS